MARRSAAEAAVAIATKLEVPSALLKGTPASCAAALQPTPATAAAAARLMNCRSGGPASSPRPTSRPASVSGTKVSPASG